MVVRLGIYDMGYTWVIVSHYWDVDDLFGQISAELNDLEVMSAITIARTADYIPLDVGEDPLPYEEHMFDIVGFEWLYDDTGLGTSMSGVLRRQIVRAIDTYSVLVAAISSGHLAKLGSVVIPNKTEMMQLASHISDKPWQILEADDVYNTLPDILQLVVRYHSFQSYGGGIIRVAVSPCKLSETRLMIFGDGDTKLCYITSIEGVAIIYLVVDGRFMRIAGICTSADGLKLLSWHRGEICTYFQAEDVESPETLAVLVKLREKIAPLFAAH
jgi:hypothetical protein